MAAALKAAGSPKVGITGFCMGGALSCAGVQHSADISAAAPYYGIAGAQLFQPETVKKPVQLHFGAEDAMKGCVSFRSRVAETRIPHCGEFERGPERRRAQGFAGRRKRRSFPLTSMCVRAAQSPSCFSTAGSPTRRPQSRFARSSRRPAPTLSFSCTLA